MDSSEMKAFKAIGSTDRSIERYFRDVAGLAGLLKNASSIHDQAVLRGIRYAADEARLMLALCPSRNDIDLEMKSAMLADGLPMIKANTNLLPMIEAALVAETQRLQPGKLPYELRRRFRN